MDEKKVELTDDEIAEEIVKALVNTKKTLEDLHEDDDDYDKLSLLKKINNSSLWLIHRLQDENAEQKAEIERLNIAVEGLTATNKVIDKENTELIEKIEQLTEERDGYLDDRFAVCHALRQMKEQNSELQKQVDELTVENARLNKCVMSEEQVRKCCADIIQDTMSKAVKDTAKEILLKMLARAKRLKEQFDSTTYGTNREHLIATIEIEIEGIKNLAKRYGVEVE